MMIIKRARLVETRRGRTAVEIAVCYGEELDWITINGEQITYSDDNDNLLWFTTSWRDLVKHVGVAGAVSIYKQFKTVWKQPAYIEDECDIQALELLMDFVSCASKLSDNWQNFLNNSYPFAEDFESVLLGLINWQHTVASIVENNDWDD